MRRVTLIIASLAALGACSELSAEGDRIARASAKGVVNGVVANQFPGMNVAPITDCIIDNAAISEVYMIAEAAVVGPTPATSQLILDIAQRPATVECAANTALDSVLLGVR
ncbi:succinate dehydrogenase [Yoonia sp.]|uniref:succinate dehydrogenase n=1 Tax=Yoonia sp. TaxID=2212373 RepID=UPI0019DDC59E|nr:succinate dehydrogenase [Yoonia sp.]MBE0412015.1 succinate dehydrogenase [Yoonia sp.]